MDGEPWLQPPGIVTLSFFKQSVLLASETAHESLKVPELSTLIFGADSSLDSETKPALVFFVCYEGQNMYLM